MSKKRHENQPPGAGEPSKPDKTRQAKPKQPASELPWHPALRGFLSLLIALHLLAVFTAPWNLSTNPALPPGFMIPVDTNGRPQPVSRDHPAMQQPVVPRALGRFFNHYLNLAYLNHGYQFFAPDPAGTHVIDYQVTKPDGTVVKGRFPDLKQQWPRLLYHRHMMLAEQTELMGSDSGLQYADHLARLHGGHCRMEWTVHLLLSPEEVKAGIAIDDPKTYRVLATVESQVGNPNNAAGEVPIAIPGGTQ